MANAMVKMALNKEHNGVELSFSEKPSNEVRSELKANGFRWHTVNKVWFAKQTGERMALANKLCNVEVKETIKIEEPEKKANTGKASSKAKADEKAESKPKATVKDEKAASKPKATVKDEKAESKAKHIEMLKKTTQLYADGGVDFDTYYKAMNAILDEMMLESKKSAK